MRIHVVALLFGLSVFAVACGGGGSSGSVLPGSGAGSTGTPVTGAGTTRATMRFVVPPPNQQGTRKRFYVSSSTQSFGVLAVLATSTQTPTPENLQIFPVATPSPCASIAGGLSCTITVSAPIGTDIFYIGAFAQASPGPNAVPLSEFESGPVVVSANTAPLSFTLNGVVRNVAVTVPSPDPGNTPNTQVFTAASPSSALGLLVTAYDSNNAVIAADVSTQFEQPITISVSPDNGGIGLALAAQCSSPAPDVARPRHKNLFGTGTSSVSITCGADVNNVTFGYDGTPHPDASDHLIDTVSILASPQISPSPATAVIQSNVLSYDLLPGTYSEYGFLVAIPSGLPQAGDLLFMTNNGEGGYIGTFAPSTNTISGPVTMNEVSYPLGIAVAPNGSVWGIDDYDVVDCWPSVSSAASGAVPTTFSSPNDPGGSYMYLQAIAVDSANNVWITGYDSSSAQNYGLYFPASASCSAPTLNLSNFVTLAGDTYDASRDLSPLPTGGIAYNSTSNGLYVMTTANLGGSVSATTPALGAGSSAGGVGVGADGTIYGAFYNSGAGTGDLESAPSSGSPLSAVLSLIPDPIANEGPQPDGLSVFSLNGTANRLAYVENNYNALGFVGLSGSPTTILTAVPNGPYDLYQTVVNDDGSAFALYTDGSENLWLSRTFLTTTWNVPVTTLIGAQSCSATGLISIDQRSFSSGPFTVTVPSGASKTEMSGTYNDYLVSPPPSSPFSITVKDNGGRTETYPNVSIGINDNC